MAKTLNDLYLKYVDKIGGTLEKDRYFQYLFEIVRAGKNTLQQKNEVFHKVVDERWLETIEDSLDALVQITENPRRFITTDEELVPVALARKITADSVRHLSQNTQFITPDDESDEIHPTKVLNVSVRETYDLYENRFIYHLIQHLVTFIDKRTDLIFWSTGDEIRNTYTMQSKIADAYEEIEYNVEMKVRNRQSFAENDADNMSVFMRIDRVRRMVLALKNSSFCTIMNGCATVRSPIQRTNLMIKDPQYRKCYQLWQFLERYDEVGYTIDIQDKALEIDEEYLNQMYTNLITNYTVFKSILEADERDIDEVKTVRHKVVKPKFVKKIQEEIVDDYDIPEVEIRKVIIEEVTQAQLDAEAALAEAQERIKELEEAYTEMEEQVDSATMQAQTAMNNTIAAEQRAVDAEDQIHVMKNALDEAEQQRDVALEKLRQESGIRQQIEENLAATVAKANETNAAHKEEIKKMKQDAKERLEKEKQARALADERTAEANAKRTAAEVKHKERFAALKAQFKEDVDAERQLRKAAQAEIQGAAKAQAKAEKLRDEALQAKLKAEEETKQAKAETKEARLAQQKAEKAQAKAALERTQAEIRETDARNKKKEAVLAQKEAEKQQRAAEKLQKEAEQQALDIQTALEESKLREQEANEKIRQEEEARIDAETRAQANTIGKIISYNINRRRKNN